MQSNTVHARRPTPIDPIDLDVVTLRELARVLAGRLLSVETFGSSCVACQDAEAKAFLARLRHLIEAAGG